MLEIHPIQEETERQEYITRLQLPAGTAVLRARENGGVTGNIAVCAEESAQEAVLRILAFDCADAFTGELLIRAAISYAFNRAIPVVALPASLGDPLFDKVGFHPDGDSEWTIRTDSVVHFCQK